MVLLGGGGLLPAVHPHFYSYLPPLSACVRVRVGELLQVTYQPHGLAPLRVIRLREAGATFLAPVVDLPAIGEAYPREKISVSLAAHRGGQSNRHVVLVAAVAVDLDCEGSFATREQVEALRSRFPQASAVWSNGVTLFYPLVTAGQVSHETAMAVWKAALPAAYQIGCEAERVSGLTYDRGCHLRSDGSPAAHAGHLFRAPIGWACRRCAVPELFL